jgi:uncharacterized protein with PIN domain
VRPTVEPPPTTHCPHCSGELRLKHAKREDDLLGGVRETFVCAACGRETSFVVDDGRRPYPRHLHPSAAPIAPATSTSASVQRYVVDQSVGNLISMLRTEGDPERREALRLLLRAEEDRYASLAEQLDTTERLILEAEARIQSQQRALEDRGQPDPFREQLLDNERQIVSIVRDYRRVLLDGLGRTRI